ncbi:MAG: LytTR family DNA-binding domain-containing protein [Flavobacteriaceae bacterium]|nr:LytTR family DNA-binding domain-containing protein [Flavobacteriaceae bacterium]
MNAIIIDDEINAIKSLRWEIEHYVPEINIVKTFESVKEAIEYLNKNQERILVFLDIEMPEMNGFDFLHLFPERHFEVIFTTAFSEFALDAIKTEALDYLLKPIDSDDLIKAVEKLKKRNHSADFSLQLKDTLKEIQDSSHQDKVKINYSGKIDFVEPAEIIYIVSEGNYSRIFFENRPEVLITYKLIDLQKDLPAKHFFRVHKSYIINVNKITSFFKNQNFIQLNNRINIPLARSRKSEFLKKYL